MPYQIYPTSTGDRQTILDLWQRNLPTATRDRYGWLYEGGPACDWMLQDECDVVVGSVGLMQRRFHVHGRPVTAGQAVDMNVDQAHRSLGPAVQLQRKAIEAAEDRDFPFVYGLCDRRSQLVLRRVGYRLLGDVARWAKPLVCEGFLPARLRSRWLRRPVSRLVDLTMRARSAEAWHRRPAGARVEVVDRFDHRFDRLWTAATRRFSILGDRSSEFLNWRFADAPDVSYRTLTLTGGDDRLRAYLVYHCEGGTGHAADFLYEEPADLAVLLAEWCALTRRWGLESVVVEALVPEAIGQQLRRFGFWRRPSNWPLLAYAPKKTETKWREEGLFDLGNWYFTRADVDTDV